MLPNWKRLATVFASIALLGAIWTAWFFNYRKASQPPANSADKPIFRPGGQTAENPEPSAAPEPATHTVPAAHESLLQRIASLPLDDFRRQEALEKIADELASSSSERALDSLWDHRSSPAVNDLIQMIVRKWASHMPEAAAAWVTQRSESDAQRQASLAIATVWATQQVSAAVDFVRQWPEEHREQGLLAVAYEAARTSPRDALTIASELPAGGAREELIRTAVSNWAAADAQTALGWAAQLERSNLREELISSVSLAMSQSSPSAAAELAIQALSPGKMQNDTVVGVVQRWAQTDAATAAAWVGSFPEGTLRQYAAENLVQVWPDTTAAGEWLNALPESGSRDAAVAAFSGKLAASSPEAAALWIQSISDPGRRLQETERLAQRWLLVDLQAARTWLDQAPLPPETRQKLLSDAQKTPRNQGTRN